MSITLTDFTCHSQPLGVSDGGKFLVSQALNRVLVIPQIKLCANQDDGRVGAVVAHLRIPLAQC